MTSRFSFIQFLVCFSAVALFSGCDGLGGEFIPPEPGPSVSFSSGVQTYLQEIYIYDSYNPDAEIYYTLDGSDPDRNSLPYEGGIYPDSASLILRAISYIDGKASRISTVWFSFEPEADSLRPRVSQPAGRYVSEVTQELSAFDDAEIRYTLNSYSPYQYGEIYREPFRITESCTLRAVAIYKGEVSSEISLDYYILPEDGEDLIPEFYHGEWVSPGFGTWTIEEESVSGGGFGFDNTDSGCWANESAIALKQGILEVVDEDTLTYEGWGTDVSLPLYRKKEAEISGTTFNLSFSNNYWMGSDILVLRAPDGTTYGAGELPLIPGRWTAVLGLESYAAPEIYQISLLTEGGEPYFSINEEDPNNSGEQARELVFGGGMSGTIEDRTLDFYWFDVSETGTLVFHANGAGTGSVPDSETHNYGTTVTFPLNSGGLSREDWTFTGWYPSTEGPGDSEPMEEPVVNWAPADLVGGMTMGFGDIDIYAQWHPKIVSIAGPWLLRKDGTVWKYDEFDEGPLLADVTSLTSSHFLSGSAFFALKSDGSLWGWGENSRGELGTGDTTTVPDSSPVLILEGVADVKSRDNTTLVLTEDGTLLGCGRNTGHLAPLDEGESFTSFRTLCTGVAAFDSGYDFIAVIKNDGSLWTRGRNTFGQLGHTGRADWTDFQQIASGVSVLAAGAHHLLFLDDEGLVRACGNNRFGQLGDGSGEDRFAPVDVLSGVSEVAAGENTSFLITGEGTLHVSGDNSRGLLGLGSVERQLTVVEVDFGEAGSSAGDIVIEDSATFVVDTEGGLWISGYIYDDDANIDNLDAFQFICDDVRSVSSFLDGLLYHDERYDILISRRDGSLWEWQNYNTSMEPSVVFDPKG